MSYARNSLMALMALMVMATASAKAQSPEAAVKRDLAHYANIIAAYHIDGRCQILASSQRAEFYSHILVIERAFVVLGIDAGTLVRIGERSIAASSNGPYKSCDAKTADAVKQIGVLTQTMGTTLGKWLAANDQSNRSRRKPDTMPK